MQKESTEAAKKSEEESAMAERRKVEQEFQKNWEDSRQGRVNSWLGFSKGKTYTGDAPNSKASTAAAAAAAAAASTAQMAAATTAAAAAVVEAAGGPAKKKKKKEKFAPMGFRPPKHKPESR